MFLIRPAELNDLDEIFALSSYAEIGLTTLPHDYNILKRRLKVSVQSFNSESEKPSGEQYLFVLKDMDRKKIVGTCAVISRVGGFDPFYTYEIKTAMIESKALNVCKEVKYLQLVIDHNGPTEIGTLFLHPRCRRRGLGRFLSLSRFLFIAQYPQCFTDTVIAELRGVIDQHGRSPFWEGLGKHFFNIEFQKADLMVMQDKSFIADLMPKHPIYIDLLSKEAQGVIGKVHKNTEAAIHLLKKEGFEFYDQIDIFEAGPLLRARVNHIRTICQSRQTVVKEILEGRIDSSEEYMIANVNDFKQFSLTWGPLRLASDGLVSITKEVAEVLKVQKGSLLRFAPLRIKER